MKTNIALDIVLGLLPVLGDFADIFFKANKKNIEIFREHVKKYIAQHEEQKRRQGSPSGSQDIPGVPPTTSRQPPVRTNQPRPVKTARDEDEGAPTMRVNLMGTPKKKPFRNPLAGFAIPKALIKGTLRLGVYAALATGAVTGGVGAYHKVSAMASAPTEEKIKEASVVEKAEGIALGEIVHLTSKDEGVAKKVLIKVGKEYIPAIGFVWENEDDPKSIDVKRVQ